MKLWLQRILNQGRILKLQSNLHSLKFSRIFVKDPALKQGSVGLTKRRQFKTHNNQPKMSSKSKQKRLVLAGLGSAVATTGVVTWMWHTKHSQKQSDIETERQLKEALGEAYSNKQYKKQCEIIDQLAGHHLRHCRYAAAAKLLNRALAVCREHQKQIENVEALEKKLIEDLKKIEVRFIEKEVGVSYNPSSQEAYGINPHHKERLTQLRVKVKEKLKALEGASPIHDAKAALEVQELCKAITLEVKLILQDMISDCIHLMQTLPPCGYAFVATGSLAREEMTPYSDLEYFVLIDSNNLKHKAYFKLLTQLLEIKIINFGETDLIKDQTLLPLDMLSPLKKGFSLDVHKNPVEKEYDLIGTPEELAKYQLPEHYVEKSDNHLSGALLHCDYVMGNNEALLVEYRKRVHAVYASEAPEANNSLRKRRALAVLEKDTEHFAPHLDLMEDAGSFFQVKDDFYRLPQTIMDALTLYYDLKKNSTWDRMDELCALGKLSQDACLRLKKVLSLAEFWRLRTYCSYGCQREFIDPLQFSLKEWGLTKLKTREIKEAYKTLVSLQRCAGIFYSSQGKIDIFMTSTLKEDTFLLRGLIASRFYRYNDARKYFERALKKYAENDIKPHHDVVLCLEYLGITYHILGNEKQAKYCFKKALKVNLNLYGDKHPAIARSLDHLGSGWFFLGKFRQAVSYFRRALKMEQELYGKQNYATTSTLNNLALALVALGNFQQALKYCKLGLAITQKLYGAQHFRTAISLNSLGTTYLEIGDVIKALKCFHRTLLIGKKLFGDQHPFFARCFINLSLVWMDLGNAQKAFNYGKMALKIHRNHYRNQHPDTAKILNNLGTACINLGATQRAVKYFKQALVINRKLYGEQHLDTAKNLISLGLALNNLKKPKKARRYAKRALAIVQKLCRKRHPILAQCFMCLEEASRCLGNPMKAVKYGRRALKIFRELHSETHISTAKCVVNLGVAWSDLGKIEKGLKYSERGLAIYRKLYPAGHPDIAHVLNNLRLGSMKLGKTGEAIAYWEKELAVHNTILGSTHPDVIRAYENLAKKKKIVKDSMVLHQYPVFRQAKNNGKDIRVLQAHTSIDDLKRKKFTQGV